MNSCLRVLRRASLKRNSRNAQVKLASFVQTRKLRRANLENAHTSISEFQREQFLASLGTCEFDLRVFLRVCLKKMTSKDALSIGTDAKPPVLFKGEYEQWKDRFLDFIDRRANGENIMESIKDGPMKPITVQVPVEDESDNVNDDEEREIKTKPSKVDFSEYSEEQKSRYKADRQAWSLLLQSIPNDIYIKIDSYKHDAKKMWDQLEKMMMGSKVGNQMKVANCINRYEEFKAKENESLEDTYERFTVLLNELTKNKVNKKQLENNVKFLSILRPEWKKHTRRIKQMKDLNEIPLHEVYETLRQNEEEVDEKIAEKKKAEKVPDPIALVVGEKKKEKKEKIEKKKKKKVS
ncbi:hypothetical protein L6452_18467 [Arctium lappa]|uniref:Uncharacterized protein n=1 Tax=Arctium lappa TaxID=4217 RepID=A0ACB9C6K5_ARCLA|nr:hypothetical protein L6452_18467 [Arctium lappa]